MEYTDYSLERIVNTTRVQLHHCRSQGVDDPAFVRALLNEFVKMQPDISPDTNSMHMALSCYHMAVLTDVVYELREKVEFYKDSIDMLLDLQDQ